MPTTPAVSWQTCRPRADGALAASLVVASVAASAFTSEVWAAEPARVAIVDGGSAELGLKLRAEASYAGFGVSASSGELRLGDVPAARVRALSHERVELELLGPDGARQQRELLTQAPGEGDGFALRVVEHLRARLVDLGWSLPSEPASPAGQLGDPPPPEPASSPRAEAVVEGADAGGVDSSAPRDVGARRLWLGAGAAASWAAGGLGLVPHAVLGARLEPSSRWGLDVQAFVPLAAGEIQGGEGSARAHWYALLVGVELSLLRREPWFAALGLGGGVLLLDVSADGRPGFSARDDRLYAGTAQLELSAGWHLLERLRLRAGAHTGLSGPRPVLRFDGREVASLGRWYGGLGLTLEGALELGAEPAR